MSGPEVLIPITFFATIGAVFISRSEIGRALAHRIRGGADVGAEVRVELADLREEVTALRQELSDTQERLDFNERMLAQARALDQLPRG
jgi:predicted  nucleic acid-binding Zn-ribbon protein